MIESEAKCSQARKQQKQAASSPSFRWNIHISILKVTKANSACSLHLIVSSFAYSSTLMMEEICCPEKSGLSQIT
jgi:hypothetical protein